MIELPYPPAPCWPNVRSHWAKKARAMTTARLWAFMAMKGYLASYSAAAQPVRLAYTFRPKTRRAPDRDNIIAALKAYQDGICGALQIDDATLDTPKIIIGEPVKGGAVIVEVEG